MPRRARHYIAGQPYYVVIYMDVIYAGFAGAKPEVQPGNNHQVCFNGDENMAAYAGWLKEFSAKYQVEIHAWVFMTNHLHLLVTSC